MALSYDLEAKSTNACGPLVRQTLRERLLERKATIETALANVNMALGFIDKNPGFEEFHNVIGKVGY